MESGSESETSLATKGKVKKKFNEGIGENVGEALAKWCLEKAHQADAISPKFVAA